MREMFFRPLAFLLCLPLLAAAPGTGKRVVLVSGDEEYRSEEALPQLAKILEQRHGFQCTVLYAINPATGKVDPNRNDNIPGLEALAKADLMIVFLRWRDLPDGQMKHIVDYVESGKPIIGIRTSTHAFKLRTSQTYGRYSSDSKEWAGGFGREILGETWINHHGKHKFQSTRGVIAPGAEKHPILRGIKTGDVWGPTDVYTVRQPLPGVTPLVLGQVVEGMNPTDPAAVGPKNDPMMPVAWVMNGKRRVFNTTMGSSQDLSNEGFRRLLVNATYWAVGLEKQIPAKTDVALVGEYQPTPFGFRK